MINSTFSGNKAGTTGGAISVASSSVTVKNSILYGNGGSGGNSEINGSVTASYSDIKQTGYEGNNNLNTDPDFVSPVNYSSAPTSNGNYHLGLSSPVIDMGTATGAPTDDIDNNVRPIGTHDMGADEVITIVNNAPTLSWTAEANYTNDGVDPNLGTDGGNYIFRVNYADSNNNAPSSIQVWIDKNDDGDYLDASEKIDMTAVDGGDTTYTDGKLYTKTEALSYSGDGALHYHFYAADGYEAATGTPTANKTVIVNTTPTLAWLGSGNYTADGVDPNSAASGANFDFRVKYTDANNDAPTAIQVWVDKNDDGDYLDSGEKLTMTQLDSGDTDYTDGKVYKKVEALSYAGNGDLNYRFYASDGSTATGDPIANNTVTVTNSAPTLGWLGSGNYVTDGVNPNGDTSGSNSFVFRINYTDADNQAPSSIEVWIDVNDNASYEGGEKYAMTEVDGGDTTYSDGKVYTYTATNLARVSDDYLNYRFAANDGIAAATGTPVSSDKPVGVFTANQAPDLDWTGEANYTTDGVNPESGAVDDTFTFRVKYTDLENTAPSSIQVWLDLNDDGDSTGEEGTELFSMDAVDGGDTSYDDGKLYTKDVVATSGGDGTLLYNFLASDGTDNATGNATANKTIGVLSPITVCPGGHADAPCDFTTIQGAISDAGTSSGDFIQVSDATYSENINFNGKNVNVFKKSGAGVTTIQGSGSNSAVVTFNNNETASAILDGFTLNNSGTSSATRGILITGGAAPTIKNTIITGNNADNAGADSATKPTLHQTEAAAVCTSGERQAVPPFKMVPLSAARSQGMATSVRTAKAEAFISRAPPPVHCPSATLTFSIIRDKQTAVAFG
ncbi:MAG: hypothetical protein A2511_02610 [Deltaproteobacteria bacterium RIFOXYD12_FULL_50_9]|nr:MAG: hypothetical protein A2511_02610 [Deltaproteobacteria bacterium RIFOXYD12_FULL_50_9]